MFELKNNTTPSLFILFQEYCCDFIQVTVKVTIFLFLECIFQRRQSLKKRFVIHYCIEKNMKKTVTLTVKRYSFIGWKTTKTLWAKCLILISTFRKLSNFINKSNQKFYFFGKQF